MEREGHSALERQTDIEPNMTARSSRRAESSRWSQNLEHWMSHMVQSHLLVLFKQEIVEGQELGERWASFSLKEHFSCLAAVGVVLVKTGYDKSLSIGPGRLLDEEVVDFV